MLTLLRLKTRLGWSDADDGTFWMCLRDFRGHFASLYVCKFPPPKWSCAELQARSSTTEEEQTPCIKANKKRMMLVIFRGLGHPFPL